MPLFYRGLSETVPAQSDNPLTIRQFRPRVQRGITIYRTAGIWRTGKYLNAETIAAADRIYYGGYLYTVPEDELLEMNAQGIPAGEAIDVFTETFTETF